MPYTKGAANTSNSPYNGAGSTASNQQANNWETQYDEATLSYHRDLFSAFVESGMVATKNGVTASQLDVTAGVAHLTQADSTLRRYAPSSTNFSTAGNPSTTMFLFLKNDGTYAWQTSSTPPTNSLSIAHATTDGSSNILVVTDDRVTTTAILSNITGAMNIPNAGLITHDRPLSAANQVMDLQQSFGVFSDNAATTFGGATNRLWISAGGATGTQEVHIGPRAGSTALAGFRVLANNILFTPNGAAGGAFQIASGITTSLDGGTITTDGAGNITKAGSVTFSASPVLASRQSGAASGLAFESWSGSAAVVAFSVGGQFSSALAYVDNSGNFNGPVAGGIPTTRNGTGALSVPIYTGYTGASNPSNPPTGSIRIDA